MGRVKDHFHEELCSRANEEPWGPEPADIEQLGEPLAIARLKKENEAAWDAYRSMIDKLPVYRSPEQSRELHKAECRAEATKWLLNKARTGSGLGG